MKRNLLAQRHDAVLRRIDHERRDFTRALVSLRERNRNIEMLGRGLRGASNHPALLLLPAALLLPRPRRAMHWALFAWQWYQVLQQAANVAASARRLLRKPDAMSS